MPQDKKNLKYRGSNAVNLSVKEAVEKGMFATSKMIPQSQISFLNFEEIKDILSKEYEDCAIDVYRDSAVDCITICVSWQ